MNYITAQGYVRANNSHGQYVHILIAEKAIGRKLPPRAEVHHANGDGQDNRNSNLVICEDHYYHYLLHKRKRAYIATGNAKSLKCAICKKWDTLVMETPSGYRHSVSRHRSCHASVERERNRKQQAVKLLRAQVRL